MTQKEFFEELMKDEFPNAGRIRRWIEWTKLRWWMIVPENKKFLELHKALCPRCVFLLYSKRGYWNNMKGFKCLKCGQEVIKNKPKPLIK
jgi:tRNA(Ile2) C34 agmatinyltransferase TiaS